jgi:hypothetical protein
MVWPFHCSPRVWGNMPLSHSHARTHHRMTLNCQRHLRLRRRNPRRRAPSLPPSSPRSRGRSLTSAHRRATTTLTRLRSNGRGRSTSRRLGKRPHPGKTDRWIASNCCCLGSSLVWAFWGSWRYLRAVCLSSPVGRDRSWPHRELGCGRRGCRRNISIPM